MCGISRSMYSLFAPNRRASVEEVLADSDVIVVGNRAEEFRQIDGRLRPGQKVIDLVRLFDGRTSGEGYEGICW